MSKYIAVASAVQVIQCDSAMPMYLVDNTPRKDTDFPLADIYIRGSEAHIYADVPGIDAEDLSVCVYEHYVSIEGSRLHKKCRSHKYLCIERQYTDFHRVIKIPFTPTGYNIDLTDGVLHITLISSL